MRSFRLAISLLFFLAALALSNGPSPAPPPTVESVPLDQAFLQRKIPLVDIRTPTEWRRTGLVKNSIPLSFFDARGGYDAQGFLTALQAKLDLTKPFALLCHSGSRSRMVANFLVQNFHYPVINLRGGLLGAQSHKLPMVPYFGP
jgi:rhodanese-related sulfurtransferase